MSSLIGWITSSLTGIMKLEYKRLDQNTNDIERRTGNSAFDYRNAAKANNDEYGKTLTRTHKIEGQLLYVERSMEFQIRFFEFLKTHLATLMSVGSVQGEYIDKLPPSDEDQASLERAKAEAEGYLEMCLAGARERWTQTRMLARRIQTQLTVVS
jgi:hypothetical protein